MATEPPALWVEATEEYLHDLVPRLLPGAPPVARIAPLAEDVWQVELGDGRRLVAKHQLWGFLARGAPYDLLQVEQQVLDLLGRQGCPVPGVLGLDPPSQVILLEYCGSHTLEEVDSPPYIPQVIEGLLRIEQTLERHGDCLAWRAVPQAALPCLHWAWAQASLQARKGLEQLGQWHGCVPAALGRAQQALDEVLSSLAARPPALGATDYNPRNIAVDLEKGRLCFIDFAKIGWDWTERRLVQYTNTVKRDFRSLIGAGEVAFYTAQAGRERARALDGHHLVFYLNAASRLGAALAAPAEHAALLRAWGSPQSRREQLVRQLALPLGADPAAACIREIFR